MDKIRLDTIRKMDGSVVTSSSQSLGFATRAIHAGQDPEQWESWQVVAPITTSTTFKQKGPAELLNFEYSRTDNPSRRVLETCIASLENSKHGFCFSSGLGAMTAVINLLKAGDHVVCGDDIYGGTRRHFMHCMNRLGVITSLVDVSDPKKLENAIQENTRMVWLETPTNPLLNVVDIRKSAEIVKKHPNIILVVDNTFLSPYFQRPLELGAHISVYSLTKYMNGHSDVVMGAACTNREDLYERLVFLQNALGIVPSPFDCYLVNRSLKTLVVRMKGHMRNGLAVAKFLESHPCVEKVIHPWLPSHPQHELTKRQCSGFSGMVSFYIKGGLEESKKFLKGLKLFTLAESLGGYESLAQLPSLMTHACIPYEERQVLGITDSLIRLSVGLENVEDLIDELDEALRAAVK